MTPAKFALNDLEPVVVLTRLAEGSVFNGDKLTVEKHLN